MKPSYQHILSPTDFSIPGQNAMQMAIDLCKRSRTILDILHVNESSPGDAEPGATLPVPVGENHGGEDPLSRMNGLRRSLTGEMKISTRIHLRNGVPYEEISQAALEIPADLIIMGKSGASENSESMMGSTAYNVIKNSEVPVLTIPGQSGYRPFRSILFPVRPVNGIREKYKLLLPFLHGDGTSVHIAVLCSENEDEMSSSWQEELQEVIGSLEEMGIPCTKEKYLCRRYAPLVLELGDLVSADLIAVNVNLIYKGSRYFVSPYAREVMNCSRVPLLNFRDAPLRQEKILR